MCRDDSNIEIKIMASSIVIMLIASIIIISGCVEKEEPITEPILAQSYKLYYNDEFNYKVSYPENWAIESQKLISPDELSRTSFEDPDSSSAFFVSIISEVSEVDKEKMKALGKEVVINERKGYKVTQPLPSVGEKITIVGLEVDNKYYVIGCTTSTDLFDECSDTFNHIINSFEIMD